MTDQHDPLIARLESWLSQDDGSVLSERVMDAVNVELLAIQQVGVGWRRFLPTSGMAKASYAVAGLAAAAVLVLGYALWASDDVGEPSPSPEPSVSDRPEPTPGQSTLPVTVGLDVGGVGTVVATQPLVIRSAPGTEPDSSILDGNLWPGMRFGIVEGPVVASGYDWYFIRAGELEGWAAMASRDGEPWIASVANGMIAFSALDPSQDPDSPVVPQLFLLGPDGESTQITHLTYDDLLINTTSGAKYAAGGVYDCGGVWEIAWSPDGDYVAFAVSENCDHVIFTVASDGTDLQRRSDGHSPDWSPDGSRIAFGLNTPYDNCAPCSGSPAARWEIQVMDASGGALVPLTLSPEWNSAMGPIWRPDGGALAYVRWEPTGPIDSTEPFLYPAETWLVNADGGDQRFVAAGTPLAWSPDGERILVERCCYPGDFLNELWVVRADGSAETRLPDLNIPGGQHAEWSPDGSRIAVTGWNLDSGVQHTYLVQPDGSAFTSIASNDQFLGWSPDGQEMLFAHETPDGGNLNLPSWVLSSLRVADGRVQPIGEIPSGGLFNVNRAWQPVLVYPGR